MNEQQDLTNQPDETRGTPKERILAATAALLAEVDDPERITIRQIADRAGVGIGLINYHFQNKDNLLNEAVIGIVGDVAASWYESSGHPDLDPVTRLRNLLKESARVVIQYPKFGRISIQYDLLQGEMQTPTLILPLLREIFGPAKSETELRLIAFQIITFTQVAFLRAGRFRQFSGIDLFNDSQRDSAIDMVLDIFIDTP